MGERSLDKSKLGLDCSGYPTLIFRTLTTITSQSSALTLTWSFFGFFSQFYSTPQNYNIMTMWLVTCNAEFTPTFIMMIQGHHNMRILDTHQVSISTLPVRVYVSTIHKSSTKPCFCVFICSPFATENPASRKMASSFTRLISKRNTAVLLAGLGAGTAGFLLSENSSLAAEAKKKLYPPR